jgi:hypothetical protein
MLNWESFEDGHGLFQCPATFAWRDSEKFLETSRKIFGSTNVGRHRYNSMLDKRMNLV